MLSRSRSDAALRVAVGSVRDPELDVSLDELGMLADVAVHRNDTVAVTVRLTTQRCPLRERIADDVRQAVSGYDDRLTVCVTFEVMQEAERQETARRFLAARSSAGAGRIGHVVAVASGKGGVGKSTVSANLAVALARQGRRVGLLDADVWGYSVPQLFGSERAPVAMYETMLPVQAHGVRLMSLGFLVDPETPIVWRGPMLHKALTQFVHDVQWGELDTLLVDLPPGTGDVPLSVLELLPEASLLVVTTPQQAARTVASRVGTMARDAGMPISGVVENMSELVCGQCGTHTSVFGSGGGEQLAAELGTTLLGRVPLDVDLRRAGDSGVPVVVSHPSAPSAHALMGIADELRPVPRSLVGRSLPLTPV